MTAVRLLLPQGGLLPLAPRARRAARRRWPSRPDRVAQSAAARRRRSTALIETLEDLIAAPTPAGRR